MKNALQEYIIEGVKTTIPFHFAVLNNKNFVRGQFTTAFIRDNDILNSVKDYGKKRKERK